MERLTIKAVICWSLLPHWCDTQPGTCIPMCYNRHRQGIVLTAVLFVQVSVGQCEAPGHMYSAENTVVHGSYIHSLQEGCLSQRWCNLKVNAQILPALCTTCRVYSVNWVENIWKTASEHVQIFFLSLLQYENYLHSICIVGHYK
jgi:hypothetical protein